MINKFVSILAAGAIALTASTAVLAQDKGTIGISMPEQVTLRWISDGADV